MTKKKRNKKYHPPKGSISNSSGHNYDGGSDLRYNAKFHGANQKGFGRVNTHVKRGHLGK